MTLEYFTGVEFHSNSGEFKSEATISATEAFMVAKMASLKKYHRITFYVKRDEQIVGIPYSELSYLEAESNLERVLRDLAEQKLSE